MGSGGTPAESPSSGELELRPFSAITMMRTKPTAPAHESQEAVRIGASGARIIRVTAKRIEFIDMAGQKHSIHLEECAKNWVRHIEDHTDLFNPLTGAWEQASASQWDAHCVGEHDERGVTFMNEQRTRFEFDIFGASYEELLGPLEQAGWITQDTS